MADHVWALEEVIRLTNEYFRLVDIYIDYFPKQEYLYPVLLKICLRYSDKKYHNDTFLLT